VSFQESRVVELERPIEYSTMGRYIIGGKDEWEEKFSEAAKDWVVAESRNQEHKEREVLTSLE